MSTFDARKFFSAGAAKKALGREFGVSPTTIRRIITQKIWNHLAEPTETKT